MNQDAFESSLLKLSNTFWFMIIEQMGVFFLPPQKNEPNPKFLYIFPRTSSNVLISYPNHILNVLSPFLNLLWCYRLFSALPELRIVSRWPENDVFLWFWALYTCFQPKIRLKWVTLGDSASLVYPSIFHISSRFFFIGLQTLKNIS